MLDDFDETSGVFCSVSDLFEFVYVVDLLEFGYVPGFIVFGYVPGFIGSGYVFSLRFVVLPSDYRQYYPTPLPQTAVLRKPEGNFWTVKWAISPEEEISFTDGWSKFISDNHPIDGDFLQFSYDGSRSFLVSIFRNGLPVKPEAPVTIQEISDDDDDDKDETAGDDGKDGDNDQNMIISLSLGSSDEEYNADTTVNEVNKAHGSLKRGSSSQRIRAQPISDDDEDDTAGGDDEKDEDYEQNMIISLSLGSSDEDYDVDKTVCEVNKGHGTLKKGSTSQRIRAQPIGDPVEYLDDPKNPCFIATSSPCRRMLVVAMQVIKDYDLKFDGKIKFIDGFGELEGKIGNWKDRVVVYPWQEIYNRNDAKTGDVIICEILREGNVVRSIKPHFVKK
ncbi:B3 domain-containing protein [Hirschfeldia incana]|nr:B3 domain-containing protein [Hirschfeldia incana]